MPPKLKVKSKNVLIHLAELSIIICDDSAKAIQCLSLKGSLKTVIVIDEISQAARDKATQSNVKLFSFKEILELGKLNLAEPVVCICRYNFKY